MRIAKNDIIKSIKIDIGIRIIITPSRISSSAANITHKMLADKNAAFVEVITTLLNPSII